MINAPLPADAVNMGAEAINGLWRAKKIRAVGMKRANLLVETAKSSVGVKHGASAARCEISMLIEDYLRKKEQMQSGNVNKSAVEIYPKFLKLL